MGLAIGAVAGFLFDWAEEHHTIDRTSFLTLSVALSIFALGAVNIIGLNGVFAVFGTSLAFAAAVSGKERAEAGDVQSTFDALSTAAFFIVFGAIVPWYVPPYGMHPRGILFLFCVQILLTHLLTRDGWGQLGWRIPLLITAILLLRRLPWLLLLSPLLHRSLPSIGDRLFVGWFGPIGVAAAFYSFFLIGRFADDEALRARGERVWWIASLLIFSSVVAHGLTSSPLTMLYAWTHGDELAADAECMTAQKNATKSNEGIVTGPRLYKVWSMFWRRMLGRAHDEDASLPP